jgi:hypothetical protein
LVGAIGADGQARSEGSAVPLLIPDDEKTDRYRAFWRREATDRPLLGTTIATFPSVRSVRGTGFLQPTHLDVQENLRELDDEWTTWREVMGDAIWSASPLWAFPWHVAIAGCPIERDGENLWAHPIVRDWADVGRIGFDLSEPWLMRLLEFTRAIVGHARGRYPVGVGQLMLGPVDTMMQARGQEALALGFHDAPERVLELGERCAALSIAIAEAQIALTPRYLDGYAGTIRYFWAPGEMVETAEDASFLTSPEIHRRFIVPLHRRLGARFPYTIVHLHSAQLNTVDTLVTVPEIAAIQVTPDFGEDLRPRIPVLRRILDAKPLIIHGVMTPAVLEALRSELPARGLALFVRCDSPAEAARTLGRLR